MEWYSNSTAEAQSVKHIALVIFAMAMAGCQTTNTDDLRMGAKDLARGIDESLTGNTNLPADVSVPQQRPAAKIGG